MAVRSGKLQTKFVFQSKTETSNGLGPGGTETWSDTYTTYGEMWQERGTEALEQKMLQQTVIWSIRIRASMTTRITAAMRIKYYDYLDSAYRYMEIVAPPNYRDNRMHEIMITAKDMEA